jgi:hypothetical protein
LVKPEFAFDSMEDALAAFARGEILVVMDDENRENEGDLITAGSLCTTETMAWMIKYTRYAHIFSIRAYLYSTCHSVDLYVLPSPENAWTNWTYLQCSPQIKNGTERRIQSQWTTKLVR